MKGYHGWDNAPQSGRRRTRWDEHVLYMQPAQGNRPLLIRPYGGVFAMARHWIRFINRLNQSMSFPMLCLDYDLEEGEFVKRKAKTCPVCRDFDDSALPDDLRFYPQVSYYVQAFNVSALQRGDVENGTGAIQMNKYGNESLEAIGRTLGSGRV
ncbi:hypothetical protein LCGC14_2989440, partial [marine sediment metagenome]